MRIKWKKAKREGDTKIVRKFLIIPLTLNRETRWLERATVEYVCRKVRKYSDDYGIFYYVLRWKPERFIDG